MKVVIPSYNRPHTIRTHQILDQVGADYSVILHTDAQADEYIKAGRVKKKNIIVSGAERGITNQRNWICKNLIAKDEWYVTLDDNIHEFQGVHPGHYLKATLPVQQPGFNKKVFEYTRNWGEMVVAIEADIAHCETLGICYGGFATVPNFYFLGRKYRYVGYVISKAAIIKNVGIDYDVNIAAMDDYGFTAENLKRFGRVLINNFIVPIAGHYEAGGIGKYEERLPFKIRDCKYLMAKYPNLFRYKIKSGAHPEAEVQIRFTSPDQVRRWRLNPLASR